MDYKGMKVRRERRRNDFNRRHKENKSIMQRGGGQFSYSTSVFLFCLITPKRQ